MKNKQDNTFRNTMMVLCALAVIFYAYIIYDFVARPYDTYRVELIDGTIIHGKHVDTGWSGLSTVRTAKGKVVVSTENIKTIKRK